MVWRKYPLPLLSAHLLPFLSFPYFTVGYFSEKHLATELHTYNCMASHCNHMNFTSSQWNRLASRRDIVMHFLDTADTEDNRVLVRITPDESSFVEITELCSDSEDIINLQFTPTWRNVTVKHHYLQYHLQSISNIAVIYLTFASHTFPSLLVLL